MASRHRLATRLVHMIVALCVVWQLGVSMVMQKPKAGRPGDWFFIAHTDVGLATLGVVVLFWLVVLVRRQGTAPAALVAWFSSARRGAVWDDLGTHAQALLRLRMPTYRDGAPLASAVHGLGLLAMLAVAATGAGWWVLQRPPAPRPSRRCTRRSPTSPGHI